MDLKNDIQFLSVPPGIEKRKERSKLLEDAGNFYNKLFVIYAKHVKTDNQTYDNIEHLQKKASEFLKLVKTASIHDKTGIFSKPIISIASDSTDAVESVIPADRTVPNSVDLFSPLREQPENNKVDIEEDVLTSRIIKENAASDSSKTIESTVSISSQATIDYYVNLPEDIQDSKNELSDQISASAEFNSGGYQLENLEIDTSTSTNEIEQADNTTNNVNGDFVNENVTENIILKEASNDENKILNEKNVDIEPSTEPKLMGRMISINISRDENPTFETTSIHSSNSFNQHENKELFDKICQTDIPIPVPSVKNNNMIINYNIYWDSTETFNKKLNHIPQHIVFALLLPAIISICITSGLIIAYNNQFTIIIPLITICVYVIVFTIIPRLNIPSLTRVVSDWKEQLQLSDSISTQLPTSDWICNHVKDVMKLNYSVILKLMCLLLIGVSIMGFMDMNFLAWPWSSKEWIYSTSLIIILLLFTISPMVITPRLANAANYFAMKIIFSLSQLQLNGVCSLSIFGENSPFLIRRTNFVTSHNISELDTDKIIPTLAIVRESGKLYLFEHDQLITIYPPITINRHHTTLYITGKYVITKRPDFYIFNTGLFDKLLYYLNIGRLFHNNLTTALEFDTNFTLNTFLEKLNKSPTDIINNGSDAV